MEQAVFLTEIGCAAARSLLFLPHSSTVAREDVVEYSFFACASHGRKEDEARGEGTAFFPRSFRVAGGGRICLHCAQENKFGPVRVRLLFCHDASPACLCRGIATASPPPPPPPSSSPPPRARAASIFTASMKMLICISLHAIHVMRLRARSPSPLWRSISSGSPQSVLAQYPHLHASTKPKSLRAAAAAAAAKM